MSYVPNIRYARRLTDQVIELLSPTNLDATAVAWIAMHAHELGHAQAWFLDATMVVDISFEVVPIVMSAVNYAKITDGLTRFVLVLPNPFARLALQNEAERAPVETRVVESRQEGLQIFGL